MNEATLRALSSNKKKRGVVRASVTRIHGRMDELEHSDDAEGARPFTTLTR